MPAPASRDPMLDWHDELLRIEPELPGLPPAARQLIRELVAEFVAEDAAAEAGVERTAPALHAVAA